MKTRVTLRRKQGFHPLGGIPEGPNPRSITISNPLFILEIVQGVKKISILLRIRKKLLASP